MSDPFARVERMDEQAMALVADLREIVVGRPADVAVNALTTAAADALICEDVLTEEDVVTAIREASEFATEALTAVVSSSRHDRIRFAFWALHVAMMSAALINGEEK